MHRGDRPFRSRRNIPKRLAKPSPRSIPCFSCVAFTGDVDTVATIALAAGSCAEDLPADLPDALLAGLESGPFGRPYLAAQDARLRSLISR